MERNNWIDIHWPMIISITTVISSFALVSILVVHLWVDKQLDRIPLEQLLRADQEVRMEQKSISENQLKVAETLNKTAQLIERACPK
jgi:hypothetical protein